MNIKRVDTYRDSRFTQEALNQHGCFLVDGLPYEITVLSEFEARICGEDSSRYPAVIGEFRFYTPHIARFYDKTHRLVQDLPRPRLLEIRLEDIQPSQFYVDQEKLEAISSFISRPQDIIIQVLPHEGRYLALDGHTRLYYAVTQGWEQVRAVAEASDDWVFAFVAEAQKRRIYTPKDMQLVPHEDYEEKWNRFCDALFTNRGE